jgi:uncharacterized protein
MKNLFILLSLLNIVQLSSAQKTSPLDSVFKANPLTEAQLRLNEKSSLYKPGRALEIYFNEAKQGNAEAMNALGILYSKGKVLPEDPKKAILWFTRSADKGYPQAYLNLGILYKEGIDVKQDFVKAVSYFKKGAALKSSGNSYYLGFMCFKGLGCPQSYETAVRLFKESISLGSISSMYMLGICYRNGYGTEVNIDSAKYWISRSANKGYRYAKEELMEEEPENRGMLSGQEPVFITGSNSKKAKTGFIKIRHEVDKNMISGHYSGYLIRYDWSGKHIISQSRLNLRLQRAGNKISGQWLEDGELSASLEGSFTDSSLVFNNSSYERADHYSAKKATGFEFRDARLKMMKSGDSVFLAGNLQLYSLKLREPEKPIYVSLVRNGAGPVKTSPLPAEERLMLADELKIYPNPFNGSFQVGFNLKLKSQVQLSLFDMAGREVFSKVVDLPEGKQLLDIDAKVPSGSYVFRINYNKLSRTTIVIKQ